MMLREILGRAIINTELNQATIGYQLLLIGLLTFVHLCINYVNFDWLLYEFWLISSNRVDHETNIAPTKMTSDAHVEAESVSKKDLNKKTDNFAPRLARKDYEKVDALEKLKKTKPRWEVCFVCINEYLSHISYFI